MKLRFAIASVVTVAALLLPLQVSAQGTGGAGQGGSGQGAAGQGGASAGGGMDQGKQKSTNSMRRDDRGSMRHMSRDRHHMRGDRVAHRMRRHHHHDMGVRVSERGGHYRHHRHVRRDVAIYAEGRERHRGYGYRAERMHHDHDDCD